MTNISKKTLDALPWPFTCAVMRVIGKSIIAATAPSVTAALGAYPSGANVPAISRSVMSRANAPHIGTARKNSAIGWISGPLMKGAVASASSAPPAGDRQPSKTPETAHEAPSSPASPPLGTKCPATHEVTAIANRIRSVRLDAFDGSVNLFLRSICGRVVTDALAEALVDALVNALANWPSSVWGANGWLNEPDGEVEVGLTARAPCG
jgi:hypothetical protein